MSKNDGKVLRHQVGKPWKPREKSPRRLAREYVIQGLYQWRVGGNDEAAIEATLESLVIAAKAIEAEEAAEFAAANPDVAPEATAKEPPIDRNFFLALLRGVLAQHEALAAEIAPCLDRPFDELSPIEAGVLLLGTFEFKHHPETPYKVILNEAIELAKSFGGTDGHKYVNGVLDKLAARLRPVEVEARKAAPPPSA